MNIDLPKDFQFVTRIIIYRDFLCIFLFSENSSFQKTFNYRLNKTFFVQKELQVSFLEKFLILVSDEIDCQFLNNGHLLPSNLSPYIIRLELFSSDKSLLSERFLSLFDITYERTFDCFSQFIESRKLANNYLYIDYDVNKVGFFVSLGEKKWGGYVNTDYLFYYEEGLSRFYENSCFDLNVLESEKLFRFIINTVSRVLSNNKIEVGKVENIILGGALPFYLDLKNMNFEELINYRFLKYIVSKDICYKEISVC